jgi:D-proline reductase (dithiol) PrdB
MWLHDLPVVASPDARDRLEAWEQRCKVSHAGHFVGYRPPEAIPFTPSSRERSSLRVAIASSGGVHTREQVPFDMENAAGDDSVRWVPADVEPSDLRFTDDHYDHTEADADPDCMFPITRLRELAEEGFIGSAAAHHLGFMGFVPDPTRFVDEVMPGVADALVEDEVDAVVFGPGCPMCHRTVALAQRVVEAAGIPTVSVTLSPPLTVAVGVPRALHVRFPFGNTFGEKGDHWTQRAILKATIDWIGAAPGPGSIVRLPYSWTSRAVPEDQDDCTDGACFVPRRPAGLAGPADAENPAS